MYEDLRDIMELILTPTGFRYTPDNVTAKLFFCYWHEMTDIVVCTVIDSFESIDKLVSCSKSRCSDMQVKLWVHSSCVSALHLAHVLQENSPTYTLIWLLSETASLICLKHPVYPP